MVDCLFAIALLLSRKQDGILEGRWYLSNANVHSLSRQLFRMLSTLPASHAFQPAQRELQLAFTPFVGEAAFNQKLDHAFCQSWYAIRYACHIIDWPPISTQLSTSPYWVWTSPQRCLRAGDPPISGPGHNQI